MALRLRRGTNAERQLITPAEGELIYTTDTKGLYIGDGTTAGGNVVQGAGGGGGTLGGLTDVTLGSITDGQVLAWSSSNNYWTAVNPAGVTLGNLSNHDDVVYPAGGAGWGMTLIHDGSNFVAEQLLDSQIKLSIVGNNSTLLVDHVNNRLAGDVYGGDVVASDNSVIIDNANKTANGLKLKHNDNTDAYDPATKLFTGDIRGNAQVDLFDDQLQKVFDRATGQWLGDLQGDIFATDSTKVFSRDTATFSGNFDGILTGIAKASIFGDDSTLLVDGINSKITGQVDTQLGVLAGNIKMVSATSKNIMFLQQNDESNFLTITTQNASGGIVLGKSTQVGGVNATGNAFFTNYNDGTTAGVMHIRTTNSTDTAAAGGGIGVLRSRGTKAAPTAVQSGDQLGGFYSAGYNGTAYKGAAGLRTIVSGTPTANHVPSNVELFNVDATGNQQAVLSIAQTDAVASFSGPVKLIVFADNTARDAAVTAPAAGMIVFNTTGNKFQGYDGSAWVDLN